VIEEPSAAVAGSSEDDSPGASLLAAPLYGLLQADKDARLTAALSALTRHHRAACAPYRRIVDVLGGGERTYTRTADVPWLPVGLFVSHELVSVPAEQIAATLHPSSGGAGQRSARIHLDRATLERQRRAMALVLRHLLGPAPMPMLIVERAAALEQLPPSGARGAVLRSLMALGHEPRFVLDQDEQLDVDGLAGFLAGHGAAPFAIIGHTTTVWSRLYPPLAARGLDLRHGILIHGGGRKRPGDPLIDGATLKARLQAAAGLERIHNIYGVAEQTGAFLVEGEDGLLYPPAFADVVIRDPMTFEEMPTGKAGVVQLVSALPTSYPGHSLLTEDLGVVERVDIDVCGRMGKAVRIIGRAPRVQARGAGDPYRGEAAP
jgi:Acyl-protein synthetase, LuxE